MRRRTAWVSTRRLAASGAVGFEDGVRLVVERGEAMHHAAQERPGTMAAVLGADDDAVEAACYRAEGEVWVANYNAPGQVAIAGTAEGVATAGAIAKELGAKKVLPFPVAGAFHTALMAPARARLRKALSATLFSAPEVPVVANVDARTHDAPTEWPGLLSAQLCSPVRWRQSLETLAAARGHAAWWRWAPAACSPAWRAAPCPRPRRCRWPPPTTSTPWWTRCRGARRGTTTPRPTRASTSTPRSGWWSPRRRASSSPRSGLSAPGPGLGVARLGVGAGAAAAPDAAGGAVVAVGELLGTVGDSEVRTPFAGEVVGFLAHAGEDRVAAGEPVACSRVPAGGG